MEKLEIGQKVLATITKNGYFVDVYRGVIVGFTSNNRVKVESWRGIRIHAQHNIQIINP